MDLFGILGGFRRKRFQAMRSRSCSCLTVVVFFHELGHFLVGRWCGVKVLTFSIGFGPEIAGFVDRQGHALAHRGHSARRLREVLRRRQRGLGSRRRGRRGDDRRASKAISFFHKPVWKRAPIVAAGPIANFILAIVIFAACSSRSYGKDHVTPRVAEVVAGSPAEGGRNPGRRRRRRRSTASRSRLSPRFRAIVGVLGGPLARDRGRAQGSRMSGHLATPWRSPAGPERGAAAAGDPRHTRHAGARGAATAVWLGVEETGKIIGQTMRSCHGSSWARSTRRISADRSRSRRCRSRSRIPAGCSG